MADAEFIDDRSRDRVFNRAVALMEEVEADLRKRLGGRLFALHGAWRGVKAADLKAYLRPMLWSMAVPRECTPRQLDEWLIQLLNRFATIPCGVDPHPPASPTRRQPSFGGRPSHHAGGYEDGVEHYEPARASAEEITDDSDDWFTGDIEDWESPFP